MYQRPERSHILAGINGVCGWKTMTVYRYKYDFEIGTLKKSPCRECEEWGKKFPKCIDFCEIINKIQWILAEARSCGKDSCT
jgi:hypothetical protein